MAAQAQDAPVSSGPDVDAPLEAMPDIGLDWPDMGQPDSVDPLPLDPADQASETVDIADPVAADPTEPLSLIHI